MGTVLDPGINVFTFHSGNLTAVVIVGDIYFTSISIYCSIETANTLRYFDNDALAEIATGFNKIQIFSC